MPNLPNTITVARAALVPALAWLILYGHPAAAFWLFVLCALGDLADGWIARSWNQRTRFGAIADPLVDKLTMLVVTGTLAWQGHLPWWFAAAVVARDAAIVGGASAWQLLIGPVPMAPTRLSKLNTALEFTLLALTLAVAAGGHAAAGALPGLLALTLATLVASGAQYVFIWSVRAAHALRARG